MSDWYRQKDYCTSCKRWQLVVHKGCGGNGWINPRTGKTYCDKCEEEWSAENSIYYCDCGHVQPMIYTDSTVVLGYGDKELWTDGDMIYVLRRSGAVVYGRRQIHTVSYQA